MVFLLQMLRSRAALIISCKTIILLIEFEVNGGRIFTDLQTHIIYILLAKQEGRTGRISARGLDSTDWPSDCLSRVIIIIT